MILQIFLGRIVSRIVPSFQVIGSENSSLLSRDPEQVLVFVNYFKKVPLAKKKQKSPLWVMLKHLFWHQYDVFVPEERIAKIWSKLKFFVVSNHRNLFLLLKLQNIAFCWMELPQSYHATPEEFDLLVNGWNLIFCYNLLKIRLHGLRLTLLVFL